MFEAHKRMICETPDLKANDLFKKNANSYEFGTALAFGYVSSNFGDEIIAWPFILITVLITVIWLLVRRASAQAKEEVEFRLQIEKHRIQSIKQRNQKIAATAENRGIRSGETPSDC